MNHELERPDRTHRRKRGKEEKSELELQRQWIPALAGQREVAICALCQVELENLPVVAVARTDEDADIGTACASCVEYFGRRNPGSFPTIEEYRELLATYPELMYASVEDLEPAGEAAGYQYDPSEVAVAPSWVWTREANRSQGFVLGCSHRAIYSKRS